MKLFTLLLGLVFSLSYCSLSNKVKTKQSKKDAVLFNALRKTAHKTPDQSQLKQLTILYSEAQQQHLETIQLSRQSNDAAKWETIINEYNSLQKIFDETAKTNCCKDFIKNYQSDLMNAKYTAAEDYYTLADNLAGNTAIKNIRLAYSYMEKTNFFIPGYKDVKEKMNTLYNVNVFVIAFNTIEDSSFFSSRGLGDNFYTYSNNFFITRLIRETDTKKAQIPFLQLLTVNECNSRHVSPDWLIDISLPELVISHNSETKTQRKETPVFTGYDSSGHATYTTRTEYVDYTYYVIGDARVELRLVINDMTKAEQVYATSFSSQYHRNTAVNNSAVYDTPQSSFTSRREAIVASLYEDIYRNYKKLIQKALGN